MTYISNKRRKFNFFLKLRNKIGKLLVQKFPLNFVRVFSLRNLLKFKVGKNVYIGPDLLIASINSENCCRLEIGDRVAIGPRVTIILSSDANWSKLNDYFPPIRGNITIGDDVWIGACVTILPNVVIGKMSVVGALSLVTKNIEEGTVNYGIPCKKVKNIINYEDNL